MTEPAQELTWKITFNRLSDFNMQFFADSHANVQNTFQYSSTDSLTLLAEQKRIKLIELSICCITKYTVPRFVFN